jgi:hypothetical protein
LKYEEQGAGNRPLHLNIHSKGALPMKNPKQFILDCLADEGIGFETTTGGNVIVVPHYDRRGTAVSFFILSDQPYVQFSVNRKLPQIMMPDYQHELLNFLNRMNVDNAFGTYVMDTFKDELRFTHSIPNDAIGSFDLLKFMDALCEKLHPLKAAMEQLYLGESGYDVYKAVTGKS